MLDKTKNYKIDVSALNTAERTALQEELFKLGYEWIDCGQKIRDIEQNYMFLYDDKEMTCCSSLDYFNKSGHLLLTVSDIMPQTITPSTLSLRDYFAGQALFGLMAMYPLSDIQVAKRSFEYADAMLKEREKEILNV